MKEIMSDFIMQNNRYKEPYPYKNLRICIIIKIEMVQRRTKVLRRNQNKRKRKSCRLKTIWKYNTEIVLFSAT